jgi:hypothetical protein
VNRAVLEQRHKGADRGDHWGQYGAHHAGCQRKLCYRATLMLHDDAADVALMDQAFDLVLRRFRLRP